MLVKYSSKTPQLLKERESDAGFDLVMSSIDVEHIIIRPKQNEKIPTGLYTEIEEGYFGRILPRSGLSFKHNIETGSGVIDSGYRNEWFLNLYNHGTKPITISNGDKIAQVVFLKLPKTSIEKVSSTTELSSSDRGAKGFGSSGIK